MNLTGRVAVVTGASQGIGRACALKLAQCGASVALVARNQQRLEQVVQEIVSARAGPILSQAEGLRACFSKEGSTSCNKNSPF